MVQYLKSCSRKRYSERYQKLFMHSCFHSTCVLLLQTYMPLHAALSTPMQMSQAYTAPSLCLVVSKTRSSFTDVHAELLAATDTSTMAAITLPTAAMRPAAAMRLAARRS